MELPEPLIFCNEVDRIPNTGLILETRQCHFCGMKEVSSLKDHDLLNSNCAWAIYRTNVLNVEINCPICDDYITVLTFFICNHIICIKCLMSLPVFKCPFRCVNSEKVFYSVLC